MEDGCAQPVDVSGGAIAVTSAITVFTIISTLPQYHKVAKARSSAGMSLPTVVLTLLLSVLDVAAGIITKWKQIESCSGDAGPKCLGMLLDLFQVAVLALTNVGVLVQMVCYPPHIGRSHRVATCMALLLVPAACGTSLGISLYRPCGDAALGIARGFGFASAVCAVFQYGPQLATTLRANSAGSLSIIFYGLQVVGGYIVCAEQVFAADDPWPVWLPFLVSTTMQLVVALLCVYFEGRDAVLRRRRCRHEAAAHLNGNASATRSLLDVPGEAASTCQGREEHP